MQLFARSGAAQAGQACGRMPSTVTAGLDNHRLAAAKSNATDAADGAGKVLGELRDMAAVGTAPEQRHGLHLEVDVGEALMLADVIDTGLKSVAAKAPQLGNENGDGDGVGALRAIRVTQGGLDDAVGDAVLMHWACPPWGRAVRPARG